MNVLKLWWQLVPPINNKRIYCTLYQVQTGALNSKAILPILDIK